jgi:hypothetical protein
MKDSTSVELLQSDTKRAFNNNGCEIGNDSIILDKKQN